MPSLPTRLRLRALPLVACALALPALAARAGHWVLTTTGSGQALQGTAVWQTFTPPAAATNAVTIPALTVGGVMANAATSANLEITVTGTGTADAADAASDNTAPPGVWPSESSTASAVYHDDGGSGQPGTADDGWGDPVAQSGPALGTSAPSPSPKYAQQSGGSFTVSLTLMAQATGLSGAAGPGCSVGPVTIAVHAQPYDFHKTSGVDNGDGTLSFTYDWLSTTGNKADLTTCYSYEVVTYRGSNPYVPPLPFNIVNAQGQPTGYQNPTILPSQNTTSMATTVGADTQGYWPSVAPYSNVTVIATQQYDFEDKATGQLGVLIPGPDSSASIVRTIGPRASYTAPWWYSVTKQGTIAWKQLN